MVEQVRDPAWDRVPYSGRIAGSAAVGMAVLSLFVFIASPSPHPRTILSAPSTGHGPPIEVSPAPVPLLVEPEPDPVPLLEPVQVPAPRHPVVVPACDESCRVATVVREQYTFVEDQVEYAEDEAEDYADEGWERGRRFSPRSGHHR
ncbi:hypothetical protein D5S17_08665 [Pseudonocardiaceae bacterium YIM PH 21723]|nr:hypothetical protein D5S17_08665 [Pseudonocardiaceae bacterium YIM PH 21723]